MLDLPAVDNLHDFEAMCDAAREARETLDNARWYIGDLALKIRRKYGEASVKEFARSIGIAKSTAYQYADMSEFYSGINRYLIPPMCTYSHARDAKRIGDTLSAIDWLAIVSDNGWSVDEASYRLTEKLGGSHHAGDNIEYIAKDVRLSDVNWHNLNALHGDDVFVTIYTKRKITQPT